MEREKQKERERRRDKERERERERERVRGRTQPLVNKRVSDMKQQTQVRMIITRHERKR